MQINANSPSPTSADERAVSRRTVLRAAAVLGSASVAGLLPAPALASSTATRLPTLPFGPSIEDLGPYDDFRGCQSGDRIGVVAFKDFLHEHYPDRGWGIGRSCSAGFGSPRSLHKEGRALDWMRNVNRPAEKAEADEVIEWLLATDQHGHRYAMARRLGITQIIWNRRIWASYRPSWQPATAYGGHIDHVHFSFNWAGARRETSFWRAP